MKLLTILFCIIFINCNLSRWSELPVCADMFDDNQQIAADFINDAVGYDVIIDCDDGPITFEYISDYEKNGNAIKSYNSNGIIYAHITINNDLDTWHKRKTLVHEYGHALGINGHHEEGIMASPIPDGSITELTKPLAEWIIQEYGDINEQE